MRRLLAIFISCLPLLVACHNKVNTNATINIDSSYYVTSHIRLYGKTDTLLSKGIITPYNRDNIGYYITDHSIFGVVFQEATINNYNNETDTIFNICYASFMPSNQITSTFNRLFAKINSKYTFPKKTRKYNSYNNRATYTNCLWQKENMLIILNSTIDNIDKVGTVILIFTAPTDSTFFSSFLP